MGGLGLGAVEVALVADAALERLERAAQREQRRAQVVGDRGDQEAALALGGGRGAAARRPAPPAMPCSASPTWATSRARVGSGSTSSSPPAMRSASAASRASGCSTQRRRSTTTTTSAAPSAARPAPSAIAQRVAEALARHPQHARDLPQGDGRSDGSCRDAASESPCWSPAVRAARLVGRGRSWPPGPPRPWGWPRSWRSLAILASATVGPSWASTPSARQAAGGSVALRRSVERRPCAATATRLVAAVGLAPGLPPARRRPRGQARERGDGDREGERDGEPDVERQRAAHQPRPAGRSGSRRPTRSRAAAGGGIGLELLAQLAHVDRDGAAVAPRAPHALEDLLAAEHLARMVDEQRQQLELARGERDGRARRRGPRGRRGRSPGARSGAGSSSARWRCGAAPPSRARPPRPAWPT